MNRNIKTNSQILKNRLSHLFGTGPLAKFQDYLNLMESYLELETKKSKESFSRENFEEHSKIAGENHHEYFHFLMDEHYKSERILTFDFPQSLRASLVIQVFSFFEFELKNICIYHAGLTNSNILFSEIKGNSVIANSKKYLIDVAKINFENLNPEWGFIDNSREIRNLFIHNQGVITSDSNKFVLIEEFAKLNNLELKKNDHIQDIYSFILTIPNKDFPEEVISNIRLFLNKLLKELKI